MTGIIGLNLENVAVGTSERGRHVLFTDDIDGRKFSSVFGDTDYAILEAIGNNDGSSPDMIRRALNVGADLSARNEFGASLQRLTSRGYVRNSGGRLSITDMGRQVLSERNAPMGKAAPSKRLTEIINTVKSGGSLNVYGHDDLLAAADAIRGNPAKYGIRPSDAAVYEDRLFRFAQRLSNPRDAQSIQYGRKATTLPSTVDRGGREWYVGADQVIGYLEAGMPIPPDIPLWALQAASSMLDSGMDSNARDNWDEILGREMQKRRGRKAAPPPASAFLDAPESDPNTTTVADYLMNNGDGPVASYGGGRWYVRVAGRMPQLVTAIHKGRAGKYVVVTDGGNDVEVTGQTVMFKKSMFGTPIGQFDERRLYEIVGAFQAGMSPQTAGRRFSSNELTASLSFNEDSNDTDASGDDRFVTWVTQAKRFARKSIKSVKAAGVDPDGARIILDLVNTYNASQAQQSYRVRATDNHDGTVMLTLENGGNMDKYALWTIFSQRGYIPDDFGAQRNGRSVDVWLLSIKAIDLDTLVQTAAVELKNLLPASGVTGRIDHLLGALGTTPATLAQSFSRADLETYLRNILMGAGGIDNLEPWERGQVNKLQQAIQLAR